MAVLTVGDYYALNMDNIDVGVLFDGTPTVANSSTFTLSYSGTDIYDTFTGQGFRYDAAGVPNGGVVTGFSETVNGVWAASISGGSVSVPSLVSWAYTDDNTSMRNAFFGGPDTITGGAQGDLLRGYGGNDSISGAGGNDTLDGGAGSNVLFGGDGNDYIYAGADGFNRVNGNQGQDTIIGQSIVGDWLLGGQGNDQISATASTGHNIINGSMGNDTVTGGSGGDTLRGGQGDDVIHGGSGADLIFGDLGNNTISGGGGGDTYHSGNGVAQDTITDFNLAQGDYIQIAAGLTWTTSQVGADARVNVSNGDVMILQNVTLSTLHTGWIGY